MRKKLFSLSISFLFLFIKGVCALECTWPIDEQNFFILQAFGNQRTNFQGFHAGTDFGVYTFDAVAYCIADGWVEDFGSRSDYGNYMMIKHQLPDSNFVYSLYMHLTAPVSSFIKGQSIAKRTPIGIVGETGDTPSGVHLHLEIKMINDLNGGYIKDLSNHYNPYEFIVSRLTNNQAPPDRCSDGTIINDCSPTKPLHCILGGYLVNNSMMCGCDRGVSQSDGTCSKAEDGIIIDNNDPEFSYSGAWESSSNVLGFYGSDYLRAQPWYGPATASWTPTIPQVAQYHVYGWWREHFSANGSYRATNAPLLINHAGQQDVIHVDFSDYHKGWKYLGTFYFAAGTGNSVTLSNTPNPGGDIVADAFRFVQITAGTTSTVEPTTTTTIQPTTSTTVLPTTTISSTTTTAPVGRCPAKTVMGEGSPDLRKLHTLRNEIFLKDAVGKQYTALNYKHALELSNIFANDRKLRKGAQSLIQKIMPAIEGVLNKRDASVREELIQESIGLIDSLRPKVSPALENDLTCLESDIQSGVIFKTFGITIQKNKS